MNLLYPLEKLKAKLFAKTSENLEAQIAASKAKEIDQDKVVEIGKREEKQPKEKKIFLLPPLKTNLWLQSVVLADINGEPLAAIGIEANEAKQCATHCKDLVIASKKIAEELAIGIPRKIFSSTSKQMLSVNLYPKEGRILIALLCEDATMILARKSIDEVFEYLNETVAKQKKL